MAGFFTSPVEHMAQAGPVKTRQPYSGALSRRYNLDQAAPLGRNMPWIHEDEFEPIDRDNAPNGGGWQPASWSRDEWLKALQHRDGDEQSFGSHFAPQTHDGDDSTDYKGASPWLAYDNVQYGGHSPQPARGMGPAAHGGLRGDADQPWSNPDGFSLGHDYESPTTERRMGRFIGHGALRPVQEPFVETGEAPSPTTGLGRFTSIFDPSRDGRTNGVAVPTVRRTMRPYGDATAVQADEEPQTALDLSPGIGGGWVL